MEEYAIGPALAQPCGIIHVLLKGFHVGLTMATTATVNAEIPTTHNGKWPNSAATPATKIASPRDPNDVLTICSAMAGRRMAGSQTEGPAITRIAFCTQGNPQLWTPSAMANRVELSGSSDELRPGHAKCEANAAVMLAPTTAIDHDDTTGSLPN